MYLSFPFVNQILNIYSFLQIESRLSYCSNAKPSSFIHQQCYTFLPCPAPPPLSSLKMLLCHAPPKNMFTLALTNQIPLFEKPESMKQETNVFVCDQAKLLSSSIQDVSRPQVIMFPIWLGVFFLEHDQTSRPSEIRINFILGFHSKSWMQHACPKYNRSSEAKHVVRPFVPCDSYTCKNVGKLSHELI